MTLGAIPFAVTMRVLVDEGRGVLVVLHIAACLSLLVLLFAKWVSHRQRSAFLILSCATVGTLAIVTMGFISAALVWLFASVLLSAMLLSWRATSVVLAYVLLLLAGVGAGIELGMFEWAVRAPFAVSRWPMITLNFGFVVVICGGAISFVIHLLAKEDQARGAMERQLAEARRHEALGTLSSGIAHDFNNLLVPLFASVDELRRMPHQSAEMRTTLDDAARGATLARDLVQRILAYARQTETPRGSLRVANAIRDAVSLFRERVPTGVRLVVQLDEAAVISATSVEVHEVIANLIENALAAIGPSGELRISLEEESAGDESLVTLTVSDTGAGMDDATRERIFDPYFSTRPGGRGTGLGLPIVRSIVLGLGGALDVHTAPGEGSRFVVRIPAAAALPSVATPPVGSLRSGAPASGATPQRTVLLVDDEPAVRRSVARLLRGLDFTVREAESGVAAAVELARDVRDVNILVVDYRMPGDNGAVVSARARERFPDLPIVVMSGDVADAQLDPDWQAHAVPLQKPFSRQELAQAISTALSTAVAVGHAGFPNSEAQAVTHSVAGSSPA